MVNIAQNLNSMISYQSDWSGQAANVIRCLQCVLTRCFAILSGLSSLSTVQLLNYSPIVPVYHCDCLVQYWRHNYAREVKIVVTMFLVCKNLYKTTTIGISNTKDIPNHYSANTGLILFNFIRCIIFRLDTPRK